MTTRIYRLAVAGIVTCAAACASGPARELPINAVAVIVDGSGTYKARFSDAVQKAQTLLSEMGAADLRRWDPAADRIAIIALDSLPAVIWTGTLRDLQNLEPAAWLDRLSSRADLAGCTDVTAAFRLAARVFADAAAGSDANAQRPIAAKYAFVFSDLIAEPPTTSVRSCAPPKRPTPPPADFPWDAFDDTVSVSVFWMPADQALIWRRAAEERGSAFAVYTQAESASVRAVAPPRPTVTFTEADRLAARDALTSSFKGGLRRIGLITMVLVALVAGAVALAYWLRRRRLARRQGHRLAMVRPQAR